MYTRAGSALGGFVHHLRFAKIDLAAFSDPTSASALFNRGTPTFQDSLDSSSFPFHSLVMGNSFGFLHTSEGGFQFTVVNACKAEGIDSNQTCSLTFSKIGTLVSIGNVTRGTMKPQPGIAGMGIWFAMMVFFGIVVVALTFVFFETLTRARPYVP
jgi:hypothetical protein